MFDKELALDHVCQKFAAVVDFCLMSLLNGKENLVFITVP